MSEISHWSSVACLPSRNAKYVGVFSRLNIALSLAGGFSRSPRFKKASGALNLSYFEFLKPQLLASCVL